MTVLIPSGSAYTAMLLKLPLQHSPANAWHWSSSNCWLGGRAVTHCWTLFPLCAAGYLFLGLWGGFWGWCVQTPLPAGMCSHYCMDSTRAVPQLCPHFPPRDPHWGKKATSAPDPRQGSISDRSVDFANQDHHWCTWILARFSLFVKPFGRVMPPKLQAGEGRMEKDYSTSLQAVSKIETESTRHYLAFGPQEKKINQQVLGRSLPIPAQSHFSTEEKKRNPGRGELHYHIHHSKLHQFLYFFCTMKSKVHTLILLTLTLLSK